MPTSVVCLCGIRRVGRRIQDRWTRVYRVRCDHGCGGHDRPANDAGPGPHRGTERVVTLGQTPGRAKPSAPESGAGRAAAPVAG